MGDEGHIYRATRAFAASQLGGRYHYIQSWQIEVDGQPLPSTTIAWRTSPRAWLAGYQPSLPNRLSHAILSYELGLEEANRLYQDFTHDLIAELAGTTESESWTLTGRQIHDWVGTRRLISSALDGLDDTMLGET
jgi:hypothetical protein